MRISTEKELEKAVQHIIQKHSLNVDVSVEVANFKRKAGQYHHSDRKIRISKHLLENYPEKVMETVKHELGHAVADQRHEADIEPHGEKWRAAMAEMNVHNPSTCHEMQLAEYSYIVRCTSSECGTEYGRYRKSKLVKSPELYRCGQCGSKLESFEISS